MTSGMETPAFLTSPSLVSAGVAHAFFTRAGGVSAGMYDSLNGGVGSKDDPSAVAENRARMARALGVAPGNLLVPYQIHSADALPVDAQIVDVLWSDGARPRCDGLATGTRGIALGVTGADCGMILFSDCRNGVIGACHAGWKGALSGILEATIEAMEHLGAARAHVQCVLGPTIAQASYEVGAEFVERFLAADESHAPYFAPSARADHAMFDLPGFIAMRLERAGVGDFHDLTLDTYADDARFYSYRRSVHRAEPDYGRLVSAIALV